MRLPHAFVVLTGHHEKASAGGALAPLPDTRRREERRQAYAFLRVQRLSNTIKTDRKSTVWTRYKSITCVENFGLVLHELPPDASSIQPSVILELSSCIEFNCLDATPVVAF